MRRFVENPAAGSVIAAQQGCKADFKCLKCAGDHSTHICTKPKTIDAKCANCGGNHPANFSGCVFHPYQINKKQQSNTQTTSTRGLPYNKVATNNNNLSNQTNTTQINDANTATSDAPKQSDKSNKKSITKINALIGDLFRQFVATNPPNNQKIDFLIHRKNYST